MKNFTLLLIICSLAVVANTQHQIYYADPTTYLNTVKADVKKISLDDKTVTTYKTLIDAKTGEEYITGLQLFEQTDKAEYTLRLDYANLLLPGTGFTNPVTCDPLKNCAKGTKSQALDYFGIPLDTVYPTKAYLNVGNPTAE